MCPRRLTTRAVSAGWVCLVSAVVISACAGPGDPAPTQAVNPSTESEMPVTGEDTMPSGLPIAFGLPRVVAMNTYMSRAMLVEAVYQATALSGGGYFGQVVNVGTLSLTPMGLRYQPAPTDRLVVHLGEQTHEFSVNTAQGNNMAPTAAQWLLSPHVLQYTYRLADQAEAKIAVQFDGQHFQTEVEGWSRVAGARYNVSLVAHGQTAGTRDYHGQDVRTEYSLQGTVTADEFEIDVDEQHVSSLVAATNLRLLPSQRGSASRTQVTINSVLHEAERAYKFESVQVVTDVKGRGGQGSAGIVGTDGAILRDGQPFGRCVLQGSKVVLQTEQGMLDLDLPLPAP
ncbi:MAG: hypothetical protein JSV80_04315 [Acidobacteriota bacterium]|nr:MAG: hypothetical protein JSV80_04315 [Acidobacteriota bacterium]